MEIGKRSTRRVSRTGVMQLSRADIVQALRLRRQPISETIDYSNLRLLLAQGLLPRKPKMCHILPRVSVRRQTAHGRSHFCPSPCCAKILSPCCIRQTIAAIPIPFRGVRCLISVFDCDGCRMPSTAGVVRRWRLLENMDICTKNMPYQTQKGKQNKNLSQICLQESLS